jgi:hypothetical protein
LSLRCPGRDRGRLPRTPGSSVLSAAITPKIAPPSAAPRGALTVAVARTANVG